MKIKKILFVHHAVGWGGAPIAMVNLIKTLDPLKYDVKVLLVKNSIVAEKLKENGINYCVASSSFFKKYYFGFIHSEAGYYKFYELYFIIRNSLFWILARFYFAKRELAKHEYDIVHLNSSIMSDWLAPAAKKGKVIIHIREPFRRGKLDLFYCIFTSQMRKYANQIIAISKDNAKRIGIPNKTEIVYDYSEIPAVAPQKNSYFSKKVLYLGGSAEIKGFYEIVASLKYLDEDVKVYFGGSYEINKSQNKFKRLLNSLLFVDYRKSKSIQIMKNHPNAVEIGLTYNVPKYLQEVCCLVSPFAKPHFSLPVIEAFENQKPVIVTNIEGADEVVDHMKNGIVVPKASPKELAKAINYLCRNGNMAYEMGINGFNDAQDKYSVTNMGKIASIYDSL